MIKINLGDNISKIPFNTVGIDMGQTLSKFAHLDGSNLILASFPTQKSVLEIKQFLKTKKGKFNTFSFTGGKSFDLYKEYSRNFKSNLINEFEASVRGINFLHNLEKNEELSRSLMVTIGTGTSIILMDRNFKHLGGSALGGGFFMGIIKLLYDLNDFQEAISVAKKGNRYVVDLKVSDIYSPEDNRIDLLFREYTAASLGKIDEDFNVNSLNKEDFINSIICMIGENVGTIATNIAVYNDVRDIIFCGGFLIENRILKNIISLICRVNNIKAIFLKNSEYCGAIGALLA
ncbi:MAG: hypothetical protein ACFFA4_10740 [Promethearchaeota archaeon]